MRVRTWASSWFKDPHSLLSPLWDTKPQAPAAQGKPCPPCAGNCRKNRNKKRRVPVWNDKAFVICSEATVHITLRAHVWTLFSTNAQHSRSSSRTHACPVLTVHLPQQLSNRSYFTLKTQRDECSQLLYDSVKRITPLVQDQLCVGGGQSRVMWRLRVTARRLHMTPSHDAVVRRCFVLAGGQLEALMAVWKLR